MTDDPLRIFEPGFSADSADVRARELIDAWRDEWHLEPEPEMDGGNSKVYESLVNHVADALRNASLSSSPSLKVEEVASLPNAPDVDPNRKCWASTRGEVCIDPRGCDDRGCQLYAGKNYEDRNTSTNKELREELIAAHSEMPRRHCAVRNREEFKYESLEHELRAAATPVTSDAARKAAEEIWQSQCCVHTAHPPLGKKRLEGIISRYLPVPVEMQEANNE